MKKNILKNKGFMMVEIVIATSIIAILIISMMSVVQRGISIFRQSLHTIQASYLLEEGAEAVRILRDNEWSNISSLSVQEDQNYYPTYLNNTWTLSTTPNQIGDFTRTVTVSSVNRDPSTGDISSGGALDDGTKLIDVTVSWTEGGENKSKTLSFYISNIFL